MVKGMSVWGSQRVKALESVHHLQILPAFDRVIITGDLSLAIVAHEINLTIRRLIKKSFFPFSSFLWHFTHVLVLL